MKKKLLTTIPIVLALAACGGEASETEDAGTMTEEQQQAAENVNKEGFPIVDETVEMEFFVGKAPQNAPHDWNDILIWNEYEEMTNIDVEWRQVQTEALEEQKQLSLVQDDLPDVYYLASFTNSDILRYGDQGVFIPLNDLIEDYAPNLSKLMEESPEIERAITFPDGNIYSLPSVIDEDFVSFLVSARPFLNHVWLDEAGLETPETTEEFYEYLVAMKELDPVGNGETIPLGGTSINEIVQTFSGAFGVMNRGTRNGPIDFDEENEQVRFYPTTDGYRELLEYMNRLYSEGLIDPNIFTIEWGQFLANAQENLYGTFVFYDPTELFGEEIGQQYVGIAPLEGPHGDRMYSKVAPTVNTIGNFMVTRDNPNPAAAVRWMDYMYSDEGAKFYYMGIEGETYEEVDGEVQYIGDIANPPEGSTFEQELAKYLTWLGPTQGLAKQEFSQVSEAAPQSVAAAELIEPYIPEIWTGFTYTQEENDILTSIGADITKYVTESRDKFISGDLSFDEWDNYVETLEGMGLDQYMEVQQAAYERYISE